MLWEAEIRLESQPRLIPLPHPFISPPTESAESHSKAQFWLRKPQNEISVDVITARKGHDFLLAETGVRL